MLNTIALLMFIGAIGKSAQLGLHTWLPDAMEGERKIRIQMFIKKYSESNQTYGENVVSVVKAFRESMDKNTLVLLAIHRTFCLYIFLSVLSGCPSVIFRKYFIKKRKSVCFSNGLCRTFSAKTLSSINYSDGAKCKRKKSLFYKSWVSKDFSFSQKFCGETTIDVRSKINSWIKQNSYMIKFILTLYNNSKTKHHIFDISNITKIKKLVIDYNYIQSLLVIENLQKLKTRIIQQNIPHEIERLQCIFLESFSISILAVYKISKSLGANTPGIDGKFFKTLKNKKDEFLQTKLKGTRYQKSSKTFKIKKDLPARAIITNEMLKQLKFELAEETLNFRFKLLEQCNLKTLCENYKESSIKQVWISEKTWRNFRFLGIPTLRDRVLQQIVTWGIQPISESQADSLSFGFRPQRSATQAIAFILRKLFKNRVTRNIVRFKPVKVRKEQFDFFSGKKAKFKSFKISGNKKGKRNRKYNYDYWVYLEKTFKFAPTKFHSQYYCLNVDVTKYFDQMSHQIIFEKVPLANKYLYFIKCWTRCLIINFKTKEDKNIKFKLAKGISQNSIVGPMICNIVLDGLQDFIQDNLPVKYKRSKEELEHIEYKFGIPLGNPNTHAYLQIFCIRYADDILILGKCLRLHVKKIQSLVVTFLSQRELKIKNTFIFQGRRFKPGMSFDFLGFTFKYPNLDSASFDKGKYTKLEFNPISVAGEALSRYSRSSPYLLVKNSSLKKLKTSLKVQLSKKNNYFSVKMMIDKINSILKGFLSYFNLTATTKKQLLSINNLLHKLFYKYLLRKFSSVPKTHSFIKTNFIDQNCFKDDNKVLLKINDINLLESVVSIFITPSNKFLTANIYVDQNISRWKNRKL